MTAQTSAGRRSATRNMDADQTVMVIGDNAARMSAMALRASSAMRQGCVVVFVDASPEGRALSVLSDCCISCGRGCDLIRLDPSSPFGDVETFDPLSSPDPDFLLAELLAATEASVDSPGPGVRSLARIAVSSWIWGQQSGLAGPGPMELARCLELEWLARLQGDDVACPVDPGILPFLEGDRRRITVPGRISSRVLAYFASLPEHQKEKLHRQVSSTLQEHARNQAPLLQAIVALADACGNAGRRGTLEMADVVEAPRVLHLRLDPGRTSAPERSLFLACLVAQLREGLAAAPLGPAVSVLVDRADLCCFPALDSLPDIAGRRTISVALGVPTLSALASSACEHNTRALVSRSARIFTGPVLAEDHLVQTAPYADQLGRLRQGSCLRSSGSGISRFHVAESGAAAAGSGLGSLGAPSSGLLVRLAPAEPGLADRSGLMALRERISDPAFPSILQNAVLTHMASLPGMERTGDPVACYAGLMTSAPAGLDQISRAAGAIAGLLGPALTRPARMHPGSADSPFQLFQTEDGE